MEALFLAVIELVEGAESDLKIACQFFFGKQEGRAGGASALVECDFKKAGVFAAEFRHETVAQVANKLAGQSCGAITRSDELVEVFHEPGALLGAYGFH